MLVFPAVIYFSGLFAVQQTSSAKKADAVMVTYALTWLRQDPPSVVGTAAPKPVLLSQPTITTVNGQVASIGLQTSAKDSFFVSLSPTVESADNSVKAEGKPSPKKAATVLTLWNLRFAATTLPGGVQSVSLSGATRLAESETEDTVVARFSLSDTKTGALTEYRLVGHVTLGDTPKTSSTNSVTSPIAAPYK